MRISLIVGSGVTMGITSGPIGSMFEQDYGSDKQRSAEIGLMLLVAGSDDFHYLFQA
ncbi:MAG: hypothetical protein ACLR6B_03125 [Blautia sp.]